MLNVEESKRILSELIKRQMAILGPEITLARVKNVPGLEVDGEGNIINVVGDTQAVLQDLINQFMELSGLIVKHTMESIITSGIQRVSTTQKPSEDVTNQPQSQLGNQPQQPAQTGLNVSNNEQIESTIERSSRDIEELKRMLDNLKYS